MKQEASRRAQKQTQAEGCTAMPDLKEFLAGETLTYKDLKGKTHSVTYRVGVGIFVDDVEQPVKGDDDICTTDLGATRMFHSVTRRDVE